MPSLRQVDAPPNAEGESGVVSDNGKVQMRQTKFRGNVFVANLPNGFSDEDLARLFDDYGIVVGAFLARDPATRATKGCGLVNIAPPRAAEAAIAALNGSMVGGRRIEVRTATPGMAITIPRPPRPPIGHSRVAARDDEGAAPRSEAGFQPRPPRPAQRPVVVEYRNRFKSLALGRR
jgi:RNA recognition motif-containing protein